MFCARMARVEGALSDAGSKDILGLALGLGFEVQGLGFRVQGSGFRVRV